MSMEYHVLPNISHIKMSVNGKIWPGRRAHWVKYENIKSNLDGMSLASFCQSRAEYIRGTYINVMYSGTSL